MFKAACRNEECADFTLQNVSTVCTMIMSSQLMQNAVPPSVQNMMHSENGRVCSASSKMMQLQTKTSGCEGDAPQGKSELVWKAGDDKDNLSCTEQGFQRYSMSLGKMNPFLMVF